MFTSHGAAAEHEGHSEELLLPAGPIIRIVGIVRRLWDKDDATLWVSLEVGAKGGGMIVVVRCRVQLVQSSRPRDMLELGVFKNPQAHGGKDIKPCRCSRWYLSED